MDEEDNGGRFAFRQESGTREAILLQLIEKYMKVQKDIYASFVDYAKAFDRAEHEELIKFLE